VNSLSPLATEAPLAVRTPAFEVRFGSGSAEEWARAVVSVALDAGLAPAVDALTVVLAGGTDGPAIAVGDEGSVSLGYAGELAPVFAGAVASVRRGLDGATRVVAVNAGGALARLRVNQSYEGLDAGGIVSDLAARANVTSAAVESGTSFPFYVVDDRRSAWAHVAALARTSGFAARVDPQGRLVLGPPQGTPAQTFAYGVDVLALAVAEWAPPAGAVTVVGEGAAGSEGADAWSWLVKNPASVTGEAGGGDPARLLPAPSLRAGEAAQMLADSAAAAAEAATAAGRLLVPGAPAVAPGGAVEITGAPDSALNGVRAVRSVRHRYAKRSGFTTTIDFGRAP
jgi:phage protein D